MAETNLTREGLIWKVARAIAIAEGKAYPANADEIGRDRPYIVNLLKEAGEAVAAALEAVPE